jgi:hypothetical protein
MAEIGMLGRRIACCIVLGCSATVAPLSALAETRGVVELFTSQGCSSCPPADKLLGELASDPSLVVLSLPIDYWDYLGWKDTLASPRHSARQRAYARVRGDRQVYTPQVVVNGMVHALGSDKAAVEGALTQTRRNSAGLPLPVTMSVSGGDLVVKVAAGKDERGSGEVWICGLTREVPVSIGRGENRGHTLTYHNVVRRWRKLGDWTGATNTWNVPLSEFNADGAGLDEAAVIVQGGTADNPGTMLGAAIAAIR